MGFLVGVVGPGLCELVFFLVSLPCLPLSLSRKKADVSASAARAETESSNYHPHTAGEARDSLRLWSRPALPEKGPAQVQWSWRVDTSIESMLKRWNKEKYSGKQISDGTLPASANGTSHQDSDDADSKSRVEDVWKQMNSGLPNKMPKLAMTKLSTTAKEKKNKPNNNWMTVLGISPSKTSTIDQGPKNGQQQKQHERSEDAKKLAANALAAVKDASAMASGRGKVEITEVRDFAGKDIEIKKLVDADSKEAIEKAKAAGASQSALDNIIEQIKKKQKLSVLDKTKKDWGEYKGENKGVEEELDAYKKSSNQYLEKVSFLQRADYREFELERDARLSMMSKRKASDLQEGDM